MGPREREGGRASRAVIRKVCVSQHDWVDRNTKYETLMWTTSTVTPIGLFNKVHVVTLPVVFNVPTSQSNNGKSWNIPPRFGFRLLSHVCDKES
jgi:hypothetical protein